MSILLQPHFSSRLEHDNPKRKPQLLPYHIHCSQHQGSISEISPSPSLVTEDCKGSNNKQGYNFCSVGERTFTTSHDNHICMLRIISYFMLEITTIRIVLWWLLLLNTVFKTYS